ncbi:MAG: beta-ketoacyl-ACP synthase II [Candidatus Aureabacteria bacterium]|nr:beta-ketoacyl-ACP synthase II [Candidatus Auribacterota bacterium]
MITGLGPVSPVGIGKEAFWDSLVHGRSGITEVTRFDASSYPSRIAGEVKGFSPGEFMTKKTASSAARFAQLSVAAARLAFDDARIQLNGTDPYRIGVCMGSSSLGIGDVGEKHIPLFFQKGLRTISPLTCVEYTAHMATSYVPIELAIKGPITTISSGCSTAIDGVNWAWNQISKGSADMVIVGASDAPIFPFTFATFCAVRVLSKRNNDPAKASRPYDAERDGMVLSEGGAAVVLEELTHAQDRGATIYGEILGFASVSEAGQSVTVEMSGKSIAEAIARALKNANLNPCDIDYINAHGNSMIDYDISETNGFKLALGEYAYRIPISSIKSMTGQSLAPAPGLQLIASCLTLVDNVIPPTINYEHPDSRCDLDYVPNSARCNRVTTILMNSHSVGGTHSVLIIGKPRAL